MCTSVHSSITLAKKKTLLLSRLGRSVCLSHGGHRPDLDHLFSWWRAQAVACTSRGVHRQGRAQAGACTGIVGCECQVLPLLFSPQDSLSLSLWVSEHVLLCHVHSSISASDEATELDMALSFPLHSSVIPFLFPPLSLLIFGLLLFSTPFSHHSMNRCLCQVDPHL